MKIKRSAGDWVMDIIIYVVMTALTLVCAYPFYYVLIYSLSDPELSAGGITFLIKGFTLSNFKQVLALDDILPALRVSLLRTVLGCAISTCTSIFLGYMFTKNMYGRKFFYRTLIITMYVSGGVIPTYLVYHAYGLLDNFWVYILPCFISAYNIILCKTFVESIPPSLEESATLDGAGTFSIFANIIVPLSKPIIATMVVFDTVNQWNAWTDNYMYMSDGSKWNTLQLVLNNYLKQATHIQNLIQQLMQAGGDVSELAQSATVSPMSIRMTITAIVVFPILCVYPFMQKYFVKGIMVGAVKG